MKQRDARFDEQEGLDRKKASRRAEPPGMRDRFQKTHYLFSSRLADLIKKLID